MQEKAYNGPGQAEGCTDPRNHVVHFEQVHAVFVELFVPTVLRVKGLDMLKQTLKSSELGHYGTAALGWTRCNVKLTACT